MLNIQRYTNMPTTPKPIRPAFLGKQSQRKPFERVNYVRNPFYDSTEWRSLRAYKKQLNPLCEDCLRKGILRDMKVVDHIIPIAQGGAALDMDNLRSLCESCHNRKSNKDRFKRTTGGG
jgi:hypothetical protein